MRTLGAAYLLLGLTAAALAQCRPPHYRDGAIFSDDASFITKSISIPLKDFTPSKLVCLATSLRELYRDRSGILIWVFSSHQASRGNLIFQEYGKETVQMLEQIHALYSFDADNHENYVKILPAGTYARPPLPMDGPYSTRIDLPPTTPPHCQLEIKNLCLIAFEGFGDAVDYPYRTLAHKASGEVTLSATVSRSGKVGGISVVKAESTPAGEERAFARSAAHDLSNWRLEPSPREETVRLTFSYVIDNSLKFPGSEIQWNLPNGVTIKGRPQNQPAPVLDK
jgi:TonB family protein